MRNRTGRTAHTTFDFSSLETRTCRSGRCKHLPTEAQYHLSVGSKVDEKGSAFLGKVLGQYTAYGIGSDITGGRRQNHDLIRIQTNLLAGDLPGLGKDRRKGINTDRGRINAKKQMQHRRVAADDHCFTVIAFQHTGNFLTDE